LPVRTPADPNITDGNNVEAGIDRDGVQGVDINGWATGNPNRVFNFAYNPAPGFRRLENLLSQVAFRQARFNKASRLTRSTARTGGMTRCISWDSTSKPGIFSISILAVEVRKAIVFL
jgi:hypothetical protein